MRLLTGPRSHRYRSCLGNVVDRQSVKNAVHVQTVVRFPYHRWQCRMTNLVACFPRITFTPSHRVVKAKDADLMIRSKLSLACLGT